jgi:fused signal recognition particle receptor
MHELIIAIIAAVVVVGGGGGTGLVVRRRRRGQAPLRRPGPVGPAAPGRPAATTPSATAPPASPAEAEAPGPGAAPSAGVAEAEPPAEAAGSATEVPPGERPRLGERLGKARALLGGYLASVRARDRVDETTWEELEEGLILADVGAEVTASILQELRGKAKASGVDSPDALIELLRNDLVERLSADRTLHVEPDATNVWLLVGVNGVGKTTTIGKLGLRVRAEGRSVVMAAGDTFRAAAADQLASWADRVGADLVRGNEGGDPGAVIFDAVQHAAARGADLVLADTAGRLHTKVNLMEELKKVRRVAERPPGHVAEVLLVLDATTGQNGLTQAKQFADAVGVTGVVLTKLDGTAKGGIALAVQTELGIPVKLVGVGERPEDLIDFDPAEFVDALVDAPSGA